MSAQMQTLDVMLFTQWLNAYSGGDDALQLFYRSRFRPQFRQAFEEWLRTRPMRNARALPSPIALPSYVRSIDGDSRRLERQASRFFAEGGRANDISDGFVQSTVILALALFMGGVVQAFNALWLRATLLGVATLSVALGLARIISLPALRLTL
jgi:hypothetical protein